MTGFNRRTLGFCPVASMLWDDKILVLWTRGQDTLDIARAIGQPEASIANRLPALLERRRRDREWDLVALNSRRA